MNLIRGERLRDGCFGSSAVCVDWWCLTNSVADVLEQTFLVLELHRRDCGSSSVVNLKNDYCRFLEKSRFVRAVDDVYKPDRHVGDEVYRVVNIYSTRLACHTGALLVRGSQGLHVLYCCPSHCTIKRGSTSFERVGT